MTSEKKKNELDDMFESMETSSDVKKFLKKFNTIQLFSMTIPDWFEEKWWEELREERLDRVGLYDYDDMRKIVMTDWGEDKSLESVVEKLKIENKKLRGRLDRIERQYRAIVFVLSKIDVTMPIADIITTLDTEPAGNVPKGVKKK